jgi:hypothetical protein
MDSNLFSPATIGALAALVIAVTGMIAEFRRWRRDPPNRDQS